MPKTKSKVKKITLEEAHQAVDTAWVLLHHEEHPHSQEICDALKVAGEYFEQQLGK